MPDWYLKYGDSPLKQYRYFKVTLFSYIIHVDIPSVAKTVNFVTLISRLQLFYDKGIIK